MKFYDENAVLIKHSIIINPNEKKTMERSKSAHPQNSAQQNTFQWSTTTLAIISTFT